MITLMGQSLTSEAKYDLALPPDRRWLNCATFVLTVFKSVGITLIDVSEWPTRPTDQPDLLRQLLCLLKRITGPTHFARIKPGAYGPLIMPEEVAGACLEDDFPVGFRLCERNGHAVIRFIDDGTPLPLRSNS